MPRFRRIAVVSDVHYACAAEQARGDDYETRAIRNPFLRRSCRLYRDFLWLRRPLHQNHLLEGFLRQTSECELAFALGDYTCDTAFVGVADDAACQSARECLARLRERFGPHLHAILGDHELGKFSMVGRHGGMRLASFHRAIRELGLAPFWRLELNRYVCLGVCSPLIAFPAMEAEALGAEKREWEALREQHLAQIRQAFEGLHPAQRVLLLCHDPTALPFLWSEPAVRRKARQIEQTLIGHLHTELILWKSRLLAGMPTLRGFGHTVQRLSTALGQAKDWTPFKPRLCPSLAGVELLKDGGFCTLEMDTEGNEPLRVHRHRLRRRPRVQ